MLLPHLARLGTVQLAHVATNRSLSAANAQRRFGFGAVSTSADAVLADETLDAIFIVTRHHTHADLVCRALETGKAVFVEKPLALTKEELERVVEVVEKTGNDRLMVGFNRRFAPLLGQLKSRFGQPGGGSVTRYLVNAGRLDADSWYRNEELEGSRFAGEGGHFIDTVGWWADSLPEEVYAVRGPEHDDVEATVRLRNGSIGAITYATGGNSRYPKETLDTAADGRSARLDNFQSAAIWSGRRRSTMRSRGGQDKGQQRELALFAEAIRTGAPMPITARVPGRHHQRHHRGRGEPRQRPPGAGMSALDASRLSWYARRAARMSPAEVAWRARDQAIHLAWSRRQVTREQLPALLSRPRGERGFTAVLPAGTASWVPTAARASVLAAADRLMRGEWEVLGVTRTDLEQPDWFYDPVTGRRSAPDRYAFRINQRSEEQVGNVKQVWEISRLQHLTLLATAWFLTRDEPYARRVADQLRSWWRENPFMSGVHWTSGIEIGIRLISLAWIRRLLDDWPGVAALFEQDELAVQQIRWHQQYLAAFRSRGSSANNHVIAEAAGQVVASCAFPWFPESERWRRESAGLLERALFRNTFPSGIGRELASDYQCFVAELGLLAAVEAGAAGHPLGAAAWQRLCAMADSAAALVDERLRPPRQGDGDDGRALLLDAPVRGGGWPSLLALGEALFGRLDWWPPVTASAASTIVGALGGGAREVPGRPGRRPSRFADAGVTLLRTNGDGEPEIWCRLDGGPHGYLGIAAHAHADALSVEVRYGGVEVLADPGTYCYHGEPAWRSYFRSTIAHNTLEVEGRNQSAEGGPFLWLRHANGREIDVVDTGDVAGWTADHDGYLSLRPPARHRRSVSLDRPARFIDVVDEIDGGSYEVRLAFHLGPDIQAELDGACAILGWPHAAPPGAARLKLAPQLKWSLHRGETGPILGWYSSGLGQRIPAFTLLGCGRFTPEAPLTSRLEFLDAENGKTDPFRPAVSSRARDSLVEEVRDLQTEAG